MLLGLGLVRVVVVVLGGAPYASQGESALPPNAVAGWVDGRGRKGAEGARWRGGAWENLLASSPPAFF
jgi:hypothetical protein